jgi:hypothetical protein
MLAGGLVRLSGMAYCLSAETGVPSYNSSSERCIRIYPTQAGRHVSLSVLRGYESYLPGVALPGARLQIAGRPATASFPCDAGWRVQSVVVTCGVFPDGSREFTLDEFATAIGVPWRPMRSVVNRLDSGLAAALATTRGRIPVPVPAGGLVHETLRILTAVANAAAIQTGVRGPYATTADLADFTLGLLERRAEFGIVVAVGAIAGTGDEAREDAARLDLGSLAGLVPTLEAALVRLRTECGGVSFWPTLVQTAISDVVQMASTHWRPTAARMAGAALRLAACARLALGPTVGPFDGPTASGAGTSPPPLPLLAAAGPTRVLTRVCLLSPLGYTRKCGGLKRKLPRGALRSVADCRAAVPHSRLTSPTAGQYSRRARSAYQRRRPRQPHRITSSHPRSGRFLPWPLSPRRLPAQAPLRSSRVWVALRHVTH